MDDLLKSVRDETTVIKLQREITALLVRGGFRPTKWSKLVTRGVITDSKSRNGYTVSQTRYQLTAY